MKCLSLTNKRYQAGFTLIEIMIVVVILGIVASIAVPSYLAYIKRNTEYKVRTIMTTQAGELERWRARQFNYRGFVGQAIQLDSTQSTYTYPETGTGSYQLKLVTINNSAETPIPDSTSRAVANNWVILATPLESGLPYLGLTSNGVKCQSLDSSLTAVQVFDNGNCGTGSKAW